MVWCRLNQGANVPFRFGEWPSFFLGLLYDVLTLSVGLYSLRIVAYAHFEVARITEVWKLHSAFIYIIATVYTIAAVTGVIGALATEKAVWLGVIKTSNGVAVLALGTLICSSLSKIKAVFSNSLKTIVRQKTLPADPSPTHKQPSTRDEMVLFSWLYKATASTADSSTTSILPISLKLRGGEGAGFNKQRQPCRQQQQDLKSSPLAPPVTTSTPPPEITIPITAYAAAAAAAAITTNGTSTTTGTAVAPGRTGEEKNNNKKKKNKNKKERKLDEFWTEREYKMKEASLRMIWRLKMLVIYCVVLTFITGSILLYSGLTLVKLKDRRISQETISPNNNFKEDLVIYNQMLWLAYFQSLHAWPATATV